MRVKKLEASGFLFQIRSWTSLPAFSFGRSVRGIACPRPDIGTAVAASPTGELRLEIGKPDMIGPAIGIDDDRMRTPVIAAVDQKPGRAGLPHFPDRDLLGACHKQSSERARVKLAGCASPWG
jgi:hypothetical protein